MKYYAIIYVDKIIQFMQSPGSAQDIAISARDFLSPKLNLDLDKLRIKEISFTEYSNLMAGDVKVDLEFDDNKLKKVKTETQEREVAEVVDWRDELDLEDYWTAQEIDDIMENREHILFNGLDDIPNTIPTKYKTVNKEVDVKVELYETDASDAQLVEDIINEG